MDAECLHSTKMCKRACVCVLETRLLESENRDRMERLAAQNNMRIAHVHRTYLLRYKAVISCGLATLEIR